MFLSKEWVSAHFPIECLLSVGGLNFMQISFDQLDDKGTETKKLDWNKETLTEQRQGAKLIFTHSVCLCVRTNVSVSFEHFPIRSKHNKINAENLKVKRQWLSPICSLLLFLGYKCVFIQMCNTLCSRIIQIWNVCQMVCSMLSIHSIQRLCSFRRIW